jgi:hypothetical protein
LIIYSICDCFRIYINLKKSHKIKQKKTDAAATAALLYTENIFTILTNIIGYSGFISNVYILVLFLFHSFSLFFFFVTINFIC